ncbi:MAG: GNAT family N-acetyltransferase, partial [Clostridia bacterium]|nr:GNAT family N-acetyltransferase [Clostridia bacterium]
GLITRLAEIALEEGCGRLEWSCLDWNTPSIDFYKSIGACPMDEWTVYRLTVPEMKKLTGNL